LFLLPQGALGNLILKVMPLTHTLTDDWAGNDFFPAFDFYTASDPTHGYVNFVDYNTALSEGLIKIGNPIYMGADHSKVASGRGRDSVRIQSKNLQCWVDHH